MSPSPSPHLPSPPLLLKVKGGKPFGVFSNLTDERSLADTWKVASRAGKALDHGQRIENLSWRLWHLRDILTAEEKRKGEETFQGLSKTIGQQLDHERKKDVGELAAPSFRWTDSNDALRHLGVMRVQRRNEVARQKRTAVNTAARRAKQQRIGEVDEKESKSESQSRDNNNLVTIKETSKNAVRSAVLTSDTEEMQVGNDRKRKKAQHHDRSSTEEKNVVEKKTDRSEVEGKGKSRQNRSDSCSDESSSTNTQLASASYLRHHRRRRRQREEQRRRTDPSDRHTSSISPPVCWRLTKAAAEQRRRNPKQIGTSTSVLRRSGSVSSSTGSVHSSRSSAPAPIVTSSTWTLEEIEAAEKELTEQGVELSGPFVAMLADLKRGELTRIKTEETSSLSLEDDTRRGAASVMSPLPSPSTAMSGSHSVMPSMQQPMMPAKDSSNRPYFSPAYQNQPNIFHGSQQQQQQHRQPYIPAQHPVALHQAMHGVPIPYGSPASTTTAPLLNSPMDTPMPFFHGMSLPASPSAAAAMNISFSTPPTAQTPGWDFQQRDQTQRQQQQPLFSSLASPGQHRRRSSNLSMSNSILPQRSSSQAGVIPKQEVEADVSGSKVKSETGGDGRKPQCVNCGATSTPLWRRDANFELQCNACGLYLKLHKVPRPHSLKGRRNDRKAKDSSPSAYAADGGDNKPQTAEHSPTRRRRSTPGSSKDEWVGIHAGSTCANCGTSTTPLWRKDADGRIICNACGLYYKLHNSHRPVTMRMDAIKRRSRYDDRSRKNTDGSTNAQPGGGGAATSGIASSPFDNTDNNDRSWGVETTMPLQQTPASQLLHDNMMQLDSTGSMGAIHIPTELWENQQCPMGVWGENCCQNLPQPINNVDDAATVVQHHLQQHHHLNHQQQHQQQHPVHHQMMSQDPSQQHPLMSGNQPSTETSAAETTLDLILGSDWLVDYNDQTAAAGQAAIDTPHTQQHSGIKNADQASPAVLFNPLSLQGSVEHSIVGPSLSLRKRRADASQPSPSDWWSTTPASGGESGGGDPQ